jgi:signal transduction histidine kinase
VDPVAEHIRFCAMQVAEQWASRVRQLPELARMTQPVLFDHLFELLEGLAAWIEGKEDVAQRGFDALLDGHAVQRLGYGIGIETLIHEYRVLRSVLLAELLAVPSSEQVRRSLVRLSDGFDQAVGHSLRYYERAHEQQRERFIAVLGHDLRQPLGVIQMSSELLGEAPPAAQLPVLAARLQRSCDRMGRLIDDLLGFARARLAGGIPIDPALHDLAEICRTAIDEVAAAHPDRAIVLVADGDLRGAFDRERLLQVLGNLLGNAIEHGTGKIELRVREADDHRAVTLEVVSHGAAIPAAVLPQIFDPFATTSTRGGLGLGLYIVQQIALAHGGLCEVTSDDSATVFRIRLPRIPDEARLDKAKR